MPTTTLVTVAGVYTDPISGPVRRAEVRAHLRTSLTDYDAPGFDTNSGNTVQPDVSVMTDNTGAWALALLPNVTFDDITPGSWYEIWFRLGDQTIGPINIEVPDATGPWTLDEILTLPPTAPGAPVFTDTAARLMVDSGVDLGGGIHRYDEIPSYGPGGIAICREVEYELTPWHCEATWMIRLDRSAAGVNLGTTGAALALELPVPGTLTLGNNKARRIGSATLGYNSFLHAQAGVHMGAINALTNPNLAYLIPDGTLALANDTLTAITDFHVGPVKYRRA